ncbi:hypothetical protein NG2371_03500 [Nocardia gamkensis]|nr:hypothetical protein [Nocardia gamkensis]
MGGIEPTAEPLWHNRDARPGPEVSARGERAARWWEDGSSTRPADAPRPGAVGGPTHVSVRDSLEYFEKCPRCRYPAQAWVITRTFDDGRVETTTFVTCALPCGWRDTSHPGTAEAG